MYRKIEDELDNWKYDFKSPFMLVGARQTGKNVCIR